MKKLIFSLLLLAAVAANAQQKMPQVKCCTGDSTTGLPIYGTLHGAHVVGSKTVKCCGDSIVRYYLKQVDVKDKFNRWVMSGNSVLELKYSCKGYRTMFFGTPRNAMDSAILADLCGDSTEVKKKLYHFIRLHNEVYYSLEGLDKWNNTVGYAYALIRTRQLTDSVRKYLQLRTVELDSLLTVKTYE